MADLVLPAMVTDAWLTRWMTIRMIYVNVGVVIWHHKDSKKMIFTQWLAYYFCFIKSVFQFCICVSLPFYHFLGTLFMMKITLFFMVLIAWMIRRRHVTLFDFAAFYVCENIWHVAICSSLIYVLPHLCLQISSIYKSFVSCCVLDCCTVSCLFPNFLFNIWSAFSA